MINLYYDRFAGNYPVPNGCVEYDIAIAKEEVPYVMDKSSVQPVTMFYHTMKAEGVEVNLNVNNSYYPLEISFQHRTTFIDKIPKATLKKLINKDLKLLLLYQEEGADIYTMTQLKNVADEFNNANVPADNIYIVNGDLNKAYKTFFKPYKIYGIDWWQIKHKLTCLSRYGEGQYEYTSHRTYDAKLENTNKENFVIDEWKNPTKKFLCFNGNNRFHRLGLVSEIIARGLLDKGYVSYDIYNQSCSQIADDDLRIVNKEKPTNYVRKKIEAIKWLNKNKLVVDYDSNDFWKDDRRYDSKFFYDTCFSIVSETYAGHCDENYPLQQYVLWTTEKTWKPIAIGHPFMVLGSVGTLKYLKTEGYKTFGMLFDEDYDNELDLIERIEMICNNIDRAKIKNIDEIKYVVKYNKELFYSKNHSNKFYNLFKEMNNG